MHSGLKYGRFDVTVVLRLLSNSSDSLYPSTRTGRLFSLTLNDSRRPDKYVANYYFRMHVFEKN